MVEWSFFHWLVCHLYCLNQLWYPSSRHHSTSFGFTSLLNQSPLLTFITTSFTPPFWLLVMEMRYIMFLLSRFLINYIPTFKIYAFNCNGWNTCQKIGIVCTLYLPNFVLLRVALSLVALQISGIYVSPFFWLFQKHGKQKESQKFELKSQNINFSVTTFF